MFDGTERRASSTHRQLESSHSRLLIKSGFVKVSGGSCKKGSKAYVEVFPKNLIIRYTDKETKEIDSSQHVCLQKCWTAILSSNTSQNGFVGFELFCISGNSLKIFAPNHHELQLWISAIRQATTGFTNTTLTVSSSFMLSKDNSFEIEPITSTSSDEVQRTRQGHAWFVKVFTKPAYCNVCRQSLVVCKIKIHKRCADSCQLQCKWTTLHSCGDHICSDNGETKMLHQWVEGNLPFGTRCSICTKKCGSLLRLQDLRCLWCNVTVHTSCWKSQDSNRRWRFCNFDQHRLSVLPPTAVRQLPSGITQATKPIASSPLVVFINLKSGSQEGSHFMNRFRQVLNPIQVNSLTIEGAAPGLCLCSSLDFFRVLICGGDGSVGWVLSEIDKLGLINKCHVGILPLGTGNDLSRVLGWGSTFGHFQDVSDIITQMEQAQIKMLDRWGIFTYSFPKARQERSDSTTTQHSEATECLKDVAKQPQLAFIQRLQRQITTQLDDLAKYCHSFSNTTCSNQSLQRSNSDASAKNVSNSHLSGEIHDRITIIPDLVTSYISSVWTMGVPHLHSQSQTAEMKTACDAVEGRVQDLIRCWALLQSRTLSPQNSDATSVFHAHSSIQAQASGSNLQPYQQFLRPPNSPFQPDLDSGCPSEIDPIEDLQQQQQQQQQKQIRQTALVRTLSSSSTPMNPMVVLASIIKQLQFMIPQLWLMVLRNSQCSGSPSTQRQRLTLHGHDADKVPRKLSAEATFFGTQSCETISASFDDQSNTLSFPTRASDTGRFEKTSIKQRAKLVKSNNQQENQLKSNQSSSQLKGSSSSPANDSSFIRQMLYSSARSLSLVCKQLMQPKTEAIENQNLSGPFEEKCVMNNYFGIGLDARIALDFHLRREEAPDSCKSRAKNMAWMGMLGTKQFVQQTYRNLEQQVQLECDGERLLLPSLQGIVVLNIGSYMGGVNFWGSNRAVKGFKAPSFDDNLLEVVAIFGSAQMAASRVIKLHHHRIAQCRKIRITILDQSLPVQVDGEAWFQPPGVIVLKHKTRAQMLARDLDFVEVLRAWHQSNESTIPEHRWGRRFRSKITSTLDFSLMDHNPTSSKEDADDEEAEINIQNLSSGIVFASPRHRIKQISKYQNHKNNKQQGTSKKASNLLVKVFSRSTTDLRVDS